MINGMRILALIPARGGSKGIKNKNIIDLCGKPLIAYSIEAGRASRYIDDVVVTTDSKNIADVAVKWGASVPFLRPAELASDNARTVDAVIHAIGWLRDNGFNYDVMVLLQPTQPLRTAHNIDRALEAYVRNGMRPLVSVKETEESPILMRTISDDGILNNILSQNSTIRRQNMRKYYIVDGSIYINSVSEINERTSFNDNVIPYIMPRDGNFDIDEYSDLESARAYLAGRK